MAKLVFLFALALLALQGSDAHLKKVHPTLLRKDAVGNNVQELIAELNKIIRDVSSRFADLYVELKDKVVEIEDEANFPGLVADFRQQVEQLMAQDGADICETVARQQVRDVEKLAAIISCKFEVNEDMTGLRKQLEVLASKVEELLKEIGRDVYKCMRESHGDYNQFNQCMDQNIYNVKQELKVVEREIEQTFKVIEESIPVFSDKISVCVADNKKELVAKIQTAEETIKTCVNGDNVTSVAYKNSGFSNVADYLKYLADEINEETAHVTVQLPEGVISLADKINELVAAHNLEAVIVQAKAAIAEVLAAHEQDERLCGPKAHEQLDTLAQDSQAEAEDCVSRTQQVADTLEDKLVALADKSRTLAELLNEKILTCAQENLLDMLGFARCLESSTEELHDQVAQLQKEVRETLEYAVQAVQNSLKDLDVCLTKVEEKTISQGKLIVDTLNKCINNADLLF